MTFRVASQVKVGCVLKVNRSAGIGSIPDVRYYNFWKFQGGLINGSWSSACLAFAGGATAETDWKVGSPIIRRKTQTISVQTGLWKFIDRKISTTALLCGCKTETREKLGDLLQEV